MRAIFIRHPQSTGNVGVPCDDVSLLELTELGWQQSKEVAENWIETPHLIVVPLFSARSRPVEVWPIKEFTYLQPRRWNRTHLRGIQP